MSDKPGRSAVVVTGAGRGIGRAICYELVDRGYNVIGLDQSAEHIEAVADYLNRQYVAGGHPGTDPGAQSGKHPGADPGTDPGAQSGKHPGADPGAHPGVYSGGDRGAEPRCQALVCDVSDSDQVRDVADRIAESCHAVRGLVNNAGVSRGMPFDELTLAHWHEVLATNLTGPMVMTQALLELMRAGSEQASVVNIASTRALMSEPHGEAYAASKGGLLGLTHAMAASLSPEVRVNAICPGWIHTAGWRDDPSDPPEPRQLRDVDHAQHFTGRVGKPQDIARMVAFLLDNEQSGFISGQYFVVDGGMTRKMIYEH